MPDARWRICSWETPDEEFPFSVMASNRGGTNGELTFIALVRESNADVSMEEIEGFYTRGDKPVGVLRIFRALEEKILTKPEFLTRITVEHMERVARQGVRYIEFYWNWTGLAHVKREIKMHHLRGLRVHHSLVELL